MFKKSDVEVFVNGLINGFDAIKKSSTKTNIVVKDDLNSWADQFNALNHNVNTTASEFAKFYTNINNQNIVDHFKKIQASGNDASASIDGVMTAMVGQTTGFKNIRNVIAQYNSAASQGVTYQNELAQIVSNSNLSLGQYLANLKGSKAGMLGYVASLIKGKAATIGLTLATTALNAVVSMGASLLVTTVITGITNWINAEEIAAEKAEEAKQKALEAAEAYQEEAEALQDLQARYTELITSTNDITTIRSELSSFLLTILIHIQLCIPYYEHQYLTHYF